MFMINEKKNGPGSSSFDHEQYVDHKYFPMFQNHFVFLIVTAFWEMGKWQPACWLVAGPGFAFTIRFAAQV